MQSSEPVSVIWLAKLDCSGVGEMTLVLLVRFANRTRGLTGHREELCCSSTVALPSICVKVTKNGNALLFRRQFCKKNWRVFIELGPGKETRQCLFGLKTKTFNQRWNLLCYLSRFFMAQFNGEKYIRHQENGARIENFVENLI